MKRTKMSTTKTGTSRRGFASMDEETQREIASGGGRAAHASGHAHEFTPEEAREAGRKGGRIVSRDRKHMAEIGREGGLARWSRNKDEGSFSLGYGRSRTYDRDDDRSLRSGYSSRKDQDDEYGRSTGRERDSEDHFRSSRRSQYNDDRSFSRRDRLW